MSPNNLGLTHNQRHCPDTTKFPAAQLTVLALVRVAEPIALTSFFPYAWQACRYYDIGDKADAAFYAGLLIASFSFAEAVSGTYWGGVSDRIGRKPVLLFGCAGTMVSMLGLGFAPNFWIAFFSRLLGGLLNGNIGVIQTMVGELVSNPAHEPKAFAVMPAVWSIGTILGPISGCLADPAENFPSMFSRTGLFGRFPFLLPNVVCAALLLISITAGYFFLVETHPDLQPWSTQEDLDNTTAETPLLPTTSTITAAAADLATESYGTFNPVQISYAEHSSSAASSVCDEKWEAPMAASSSKCFTKPILTVIVALGLYSYVSMTYDTLIPIFLQDEDSPRPFAGGLGLSMQRVGIIMSINGVIALLIQAVVFPLLAARLGVWRLFVVVTVGHPLAFFVVPFLSLLAPSSRWLLAGVYAALTVRNFFNIIAYPLLLILIKEAAPSAAMLGRINGLAASTGGACRMVASPVAGVLYGVGADMGFSPVPWWASAAVALAGACQVPFFERQRSKTAHIGTVVAWKARSGGDGLEGGPGRVEESDDTDVEA